MLTALGIICLIPIVLLVISFFAFIAFIGYAILEEAYPEDIGCLIMIALIISVILSIIGVVLLLIA